MSDDSTVDRKLGCPSWPAAFDCLDEIVAARRDEAAIRADEREACAREVEAMHHDTRPWQAAARLRAGEQTTTTPRERRCTCTRTVPSDAESRELDPACPWHGRPSSPTTTKDER